jgi:magnesium-transporting ATPase (P-type)
MYNIFFSACPIFTYGLQEQPYTAKTLMESPHLYKDLARNKTLGWMSFMRWNLRAIFHAAIVFYIPRILWTDKADLGDWSSFGTVVYLGTIAITNMKVCGLIFVLQLNVFQLTPVIRNWCACRCWK